MASKIDQAAIMAPRDGDTPAETRWLAAFYGFTHYRTRIRCRNDHASLRLASTGECLECTADRWTRWAAKHPEEAKAKREAMMVAKGVLPSNQDGTAIR